MALLLRNVFLLSAIAAALPGQSLPWYLHGHYPAASATAVPTNTRIQLQQENPLTVQQPQYSLKSASGAAVTLTTTGYYNSTAGYDNDITLTPAAPLSPSTRYTFTVTPDPTGGSPYSFSFTTGLGPDTTPPHLIGFSPRSGSSGIGVQGPFTVTFDKRLLASVADSSSVLLRGPGGFGFSVAVHTTDDGMGIVIQSQTTSWPASLQLTVDPSKFQDASGNAGQGPPQVAQYTTFVATSQSGPVLKGYFPADGDTGLPLNVSIRLLFDRQIDQSTAASGIILSAGGTAVQTGYEPFAGGLGIALKPGSLLAPSQTFQVTVNARLLDSAGFPVQQPSSFQFTTGANPDGTPAQLLAWSPQYGSPVPLNAVAAIRVNKRIMPLSALIYTNLRGPGNSLTPAKATISPDGQTFILQPASPLDPLGSYGVSFNDVVDVTGTSFNGGVDFTTGVTADSTPPTVLAVTPADGAQGLPTGVPIQVLFNEVLGIPQIADSIRLSAAGQSIPARISMDGSLVTLAPLRALAANTTYALELNGITDLAGNVMAPSATQFSTGSQPAPAVPVQLLSSIPALNDQGVDVNTPISLTFDSALSPLAAFNGFTVRDATGLYPATATVSGGTLTIQPGHALLPNSTVTVLVSSTDVTGRFFQTQIVFRTGASSDATPFQVNAVSPPDGAAINGLVRTITLTFNKAVNAASLAGNGITAFSNGALVRVTAMRANNDLSLVVTPAIDSGDVTLVADSAVTDFAGNPLVPFRARYTFSISGESTQYPRSVLAMRPPSGASGVPARTAITWFFSKPVDQATVESSLVVTADGIPVAGHFSVSSDGMIVIFQSDFPYSAGASIRFFQRAVLFQDDYGASFTIAPATVPPLKLVRYTPGATAPANSVLEFEFSGPVSPGQNFVTLHQGVVNSTLPGALVPTVATSPRNNVIRLTPAAPLAPGSYVIVISPDTENPLQPYQPNFIPFRATAAVSSSPSPPITAPLANSTAVPVNASVRAAFGTALNPLTVTERSVTIQSNGMLMTSLVYRSPDSRGLVVTPTQPFPPDAQVLVSMAGLEDVYGNPVPGKVWSFVAGEAADFQPPALIETSLPNNVNPVPAIPANGSIVFVFSEPVDPQSPALPYDPGLPLDLRYSDDLRTITLTPNPRFAKGQHYDLYLDHVTDLSGNSTNGYPEAHFYVAFDADTTPPSLLQVSPGDGQQGLPLNVQIIAVFDEALYTPSLDNIRLRRGDETIPLIQQTSDLRHVRFAPVQPLDPNTAYTVEIAGVTDLSGNAMAGTFKRTFSTGDRVDTVTPSAQLLATGAPNVPIRIVFSKPVSPATVDSQSITLSSASNSGNSWFWIPTPATVTLSDDAMTVVITPASPLTPGWRYLVSSSNVRDSAGNLASGVGGPGPSFTTAFAPDNRPPVVTITPTGGSVGIPYYTRLRATVDKALLPQQSGGPLFRVTANGQPVSGTVVQSGTSFNFTPDVPLATSTTYRIDVASLTDLAGNASEPASSTFTTAAATAPALQQLQFVSSQPANGDVGVDVGSPIVMTFNNPVDPASVNFGGIQIRTSFVTTGRFSVSGKTVTFTPSEPWPSAATVNVNFGTSGYFFLQDVVGNKMSPYVFQGFSFKTGAASDPTPPQLVSASPQAGAPLAAPSASFRLTFSKTVAVGAGGLTSFSGTQANPIIAGYDSSDLHTLTFDTNVPADSQLTIVGTDAIVDRSGNSVTPFALQYPTVAAETAGPPAVVSVTPQSFATNVAPTTPIVLQFSKAMDPQSLFKSVRVTQDGENITGTLAISNSNRTIQFTPDNPYGAGSRIDAFVLETAQDASGLIASRRYSTSFTVAGQKPMSAYEVGFGNAVAPDAALEVAFDRRLDPLTVVGGNIWLREGHRAIAGQVSMRGDRIVRFVPAGPLAIGMDYVLTVGSGLRAANGTGTLPEEFKVQVEAAATPAAVESVEATAINGRPAVHVRFSAPVSPLSIDQAALLSADGKDIAIDWRVGPGFHDVWLIPQQAGTDLGALTLAIREMEDRTGRRVAPALFRLRRQGQ